MNAYTDDDQVSPAGEFRSSRLQEFCQDSLRKTSWAYIAWLILAGLMAFTVYYISRNWPLRSIRPAVWFYYAVVGVHVVNRLKKGGKANVLSPDLVFVLLYTTFHLGYVALYDLGIVPYSSPPLVFESAIPKALFIVNLGLVSFLLGYEIAGGKIGTQITTASVPRPGWCVAGFVFIIIGLGAHLTVLGSLGLQFFRQYGYVAFQNIEKFGGSFYLMATYRYATHLMGVGIVIHTVSSALRHGKLFKSKLALGLVVAYFILVILEGSRSALVELGAPLILVRHYFIKKIRVRSLVGLAAAVLTLFTVMALVRTYAFEPKKMLEEYKHRKLEERVTWASPLIEMGTSFRVVNLTVHAVPAQEPYWHGASWRDAVFHIIPFLQGFALRQGWATWSPAAWVTITYYGTGSKVAGKGFTVAAEGYLNFGYAGVILEMMFLGTFIRWVTVKFSKTPSAAWAVIMIGCIGIAVSIIRFELSVLLAPCARIMVVAGLLEMFLGSESAYEYETEEGTIFTHRGISYPNGSY